MNAVLPPESGESKAGLSRRGLLAASLATAAMPWPEVARAEGSGPIRLCQSADLSGPLAEIGQALQAGAKLCFDSVNAKGGVLGRPIEVETRDDGYDGKRALANVHEFLSDPRTFALFNCVGTPVAEAVLPKVVENGVPFFAPYTGAVLPQMKSARNVFVVRANYADETEELIKHLATIGIRRVGIAYQNNAFGLDAFNGAKAAMARHGLPAATSATVESTGADAVKAASILSAAAPEAVLIGLSGKPALEFIKAIRVQRRGMPLFGMSVLGTTSTLKALGADATGISLTQVVPSMGSVSTPVVREFLRDWKAANKAQEASPQALEGYINARVFVEILTRAGRSPTRGAFVDAAWRMRRYDLGGFEVSFIEPGRSGSRFVELVMARNDGRLIR